MHFDVFIGSRHVEVNSTDYVGQVQNSLYGMHGRVQSSDTATDTTNVLRDGQRRARQGRGGSGGPDHNDCGRERRYRYRQACKQK